MLSMHLNVYQCTIIAHASIASIYFYEVRNKHALNWLVFSLIIYDFSSFIPTQINFKMSIP